MDATIVEGLTSLLIRYIHFFSSVMWWGIMFFMFVVIFPVNKGGAYSSLFSRVQRFMKVIASIAIASGILLILVNSRIGIESLFTSNWGYIILTGGAISLFVYMHILMQNTRVKKTDHSGLLASPRSSPSSSSIPKERKMTKDIAIIIGNKSRRKKKLPKILIPWLFFILLTITVALMIYASHGL
jgi:low affinity Fe/Cu permease